MDKQYYFRRIDFDKVVCAGDFDQAYMVPNEDCETVAKLCCENKDKFMDRLAEAIFKARMFSFYSAYDINKYLENQNLEEFLKNLELKDSKFYVEKEGGLGTSIFNDCGLIFEFTESEFDSELKEHVSKACNVFVPFYQIRLAMIKASLVNKKSFDEKQKAVLSYFTQDAPRNDVKSYWYKDFKIEQFKKKGLFSKGTALVSMKKPQMLIDLEERINKLLEKEEIKVLFVPYDSMIGLDINECKPLWKYSNPNKLDTWTDEYEIEERDHLISISKETCFEIEIKHSLKEDIGLYNAGADLSTEICFISLKK